MGTLLVVTVVGAIAAWVSSRRKTNVRVLQGIRLELERRDRVARLKCNAVIALLVVLTIVILAVWR